METYRSDAVVIGGGVIGLAAARALAISGRETIIVERNSRIGMETSSRNSEVVHAGLHYRPGSLKARHCVRGRELLYAYCRERGIAAPRLGKLIVATAEEQIAALEAIKVQGEANGAGDLRLLSADDARRLEPEVACVRALHSPATGIVDSHHLMTSLLADAERHGGLIALRTEALRCDVRGTDLRVLVRTGQSLTALDTPVLVNAAGLHAPGLAAKMEGLDPAHVPNQRLAKGSYARLSGRSPFKRPIYPIPEPGGLGIHVTVNLAGEARFGPDVEWLDHHDPERIDYAVDPAIGERFAKSIRAYWPDVRTDRLPPDYSGARPKLSGPGEPNVDFRIDGASRHGIAGLVNLFGIESPGLTSALSIAEQILDELGIASDGHQQRWGAR